MMRPSARLWRLAIVAVGVAASVAARSLPGQQKKPEPAFAITGIVLNARDNSPVLRCAVTARLVEGGRGVSREPLLADTDEHGRFSLSLPSAGNWELMASAHTIHTQPLDGHDGFFTGIVLTAQSPMYDVVFHAVPDALLTGVVTDEAGEAVRNAQVTLFSLDPGGRQTGSSPMQQRQNAQTDDRGHFEMAGLDPGGYMVQVQARPWYASAAAPQLRNQTAAPPAPDPSLDVVYPATWYPGVSDASSAGVLMAHPGDVLQADFRLIPQSAAHLLVASSGPRPAQNGRPGMQDGPAGAQNPNVSLLLADGSLQQVFGQVSVTPAGDLDIGGLAPGRYQVALPGGAPGTAARTSMILVQSGSSTTLSAAPPETSVTIAVDGGTNVDPSQIVLVDSSTGQSFSPFERPGGGGRPPGPQGPSPRPDGPSTTRNQGGSRDRPGGGQAAGSASRGRSRSSKDGEEITFQVPAGRYDVGVRDAAAFVTGIAATRGAVAVGRTVTIPDGAARLTVHLASGFASVTGVASFADKPSVGAMVLLVPATLGDPASLTIVRRDQTNSDGSFHLENVIPGQYILLAIDHGWGVRWTDPATLRPYLMAGTPLELRSSTVVRPKLTALVP